MVIGLGVGEQHLRAFARDPRCRIAAICDFNAQQLERLASEFADVTRVADADDILDDPAIDVVSIATYDDMHAAQIIRALQNGKHVFVEKPLCTSPGELREIRGLLDSSPNLRISSNLILRRSPRFLELRRMIRAGEFGDLFHLQGDYNYGRLHKITRGWRGLRPTYSVVHGGAIHMIDLVLWLTGDQIVEVAAYGNRIASRGSSFRFNDMVAAVLKFASGMAGTITANFGCVMPHNHGLTIHGTKATFINGVPNGLLYRSRGPHDPPEIFDLPHPGAAKGDLIRGFIDSVVDNAEPEIQPRELFETMAVCIAIEQAAATGRAARVEQIQ